MLACSQRFLLPLLWKTFHFSPEFRTFFVVGCLGLIRIKRVFRDGHMMYWCFDRVVWRDMVPLWSNLGFSLLRRTILDWVADQPMTWAVFWIVGLLTSLRSFISGMPKCYAPEACRITPSLSLGERSTLAPGIHGANGACLCSSASVHFGTRPI